MLAHKFHKPLWGLCLIVLAAALFAVPAFAQTLHTIGEDPVPLGAAVVRTPTTGSNQVGNGKTTIDISNVSEGYVMCRYSGSVGKIKVQINIGGGSTYTYNLNNSGSFEVFPLTAGNGTYTINVYENVSGDQYALSYGTTVSVSLSNAMSPYLYPSQFVNFNANSNTVRTGESLTAGVSDQLTTVSNIYNYVINNISYDSGKASQVSAGQLSGYVPNVDSVLSAGKGICFDYAAVMAAMLRSQNIPTQLRVGYAGSVYHAWISVYITEVGWVNNIIYFDGQSWKLMDPTFASSGGQSDEIMQYIGNGSNYSTVYVY